MKTIAVYSPYIPKHAGGGERYVLSVAEASSKVASTVLLVAPHEVEAAKKSFSQYEKTFGLDLSRVQVRATAIGQGKNPLKLLAETAEYDVLFALTDGSIFPTLAKRSYLLIQIPWTRTLSLAEQVKLTGWKQIIANSDFVERIVTKAWNTKKISVITPYVDVSAFQPEEKEKIIISVGRFFAHKESNSKRQDVLIEAFKELVDRYHPRGWQLYLVGNVDPSKDSYEYVTQLKEQARGYPVSFFTSASYEQLRGLLASSSFYWHAAGYQVDEKLHPEHTEHFGITTIEAMSSGCIPLVVAKGGQKEIVTDPELQWNTPQELAEKTFALLRETPSTLDTKRQMLQQEVHQYSKDVFTSKVQSLL